MSSEWLLVAFALCLWVGYQGALTLYRARVARTQIAATTPFSHPTDEGSRALLVLGDSTAVGVGATTPEESLAGLLAQEIQATSVENYAVSGACLDELDGQKARARFPAYECILIQAGANDIILFKNLTRSAAMLGLLLGSLPPARHIFVLSAGDIGRTTIFPPLMRPFLSYTNGVLHRLLEKTCMRHGATYVNLYEPLLHDPFVQEPDKYLSEDGLHPSSEGYRRWFEKVRAHLI